MTRENYLSLVNELCGCVVALGYDRTYNVALVEDTLLHKEKGYFVRFDAEEIDQESAERVDTQALTVIVSMYVSTAAENYPDTMATLAYDTSTIKQSMKDTNVVLDNRYGVFQVLFGATKFEYTKNIIAASFAVVVKHQL